MNPTFNAPIWFPPSSGVHRERKRPSRIIQGRFNTRILVKLQRELYAAQQELDEIDMLLLRVYQSYCEQAPFPKPLILNVIRRDKQSSYQIDWARLQRALARLQVIFISGQTDSLGRKLANNVVLFIQHVFNITIHRRTCPRIFLQDSYLTMICAQAVIAQGVKLIPEIDINYLPDKERFCFALLDDFDNMLRDESSMDREFAISFFINSYFYHSLNPVIT